MIQKFALKGRRNFLLGLGSMALTTNLGKLEKENLLSSIKSTSLAQKQFSSLKDKAAEKGIIYGSYVEGKYADFFADIEFQSLFIRECALLIGGFQWSRIYNRADTFDFSGTDALAEFAAENQMLLRGQSLIYHQFQPQWLIDRFQDSATTSAQIRDILVDSISTIVGRYAGKMHSWVVVNEAINIADGRADNLRDTTISPALSSNGWGKYPTWMNFLGADYIDLAFRTAHEADPQALLIYNEYDLCYDTPEQESKRVAVLNLLKSLKSKNTPIHALGIQAHLDGNKNRQFNRHKFKRFLKKVAKLGLKIIISELDVSDRDLGANKSRRDRIVATAYRKLLSAALSEPAVISVTTWGLSDRYSWLSWHKPRKDKLPVRPLPFNDKLEPKLAYARIADAFENAPQR